jgi:hypothetical protein
LKQGGGKGKGGSYEREICEILSLWMSDGKDSDWFWRTAGSGSRGTNRKSKGMGANQVGDIVAVDEKGAPLTNQYFIECKHYKNLNLDSLIYGTPKNNSILEFWCKTQEDSFYFAKRPVIIARQNNKRDLIGVDQLTKNKLVLNNYWFAPLSSYPLLELHLYFLEDFLTIVDPVVFTNFESK